MNNTQHKLLVQHIVSSITYSNNLELEINQNQVVERLLHTGSRDKEELIKLAKELITKKKHQFSRKGYDITSLNLLHDTLRKYNFEGNIKPLIEIEMIVKHSLLEFPITPDEMNKTIIAIAQYCFDRQENNYEKYKEYLLKSKIVKKTNQPLAVFEAQAQRFVDEFGDMFQEKEVVIDEFEDIALDENDLHLMICSGCEKEKECHEKCDKYVKERKKINAK